MDLSSDMGPKVMAFQNQNLYIDPCRWFSSQNQSLSQIASSACHVVTEYCTACLLGNGPSSLQDTEPAAKRFCKGDKDYSQVHVVTLQGVCPELPQH